VPVFPPTFTPAGFADTTELVPIAGTDTTYVHRSILLLKFARAATQAARQAAVDSVQGIVVGGQPLFDADGFYYVAVPAGAGSDSVINAARKLRQFSQVSFAGPNYYWAANSLAYLKPKDGSNWRTWRLSRDSVGTEHNWAEEMIELPNAWGCSVGDTSVHVGIIDHAFHTIADNASNVRFTDIINQRPTVHNDVVGTWHGDAVTNVLAAEGNNNTGVTGTTWKASVYRYELGHPDPKGGFVQKHGVDQLEGRRILPAIADLMVKNRVRVINLSLGSGAPRGQALNAAEDSIEQQKADLLHTTLAEMDSTSLPRPLLVIAADNRNRPASENGFARVRMYPSDSGNVLVVGATTNTTSHASTLASYSGYGNLVQIAAPGSSIYTIDAAGVEDSISGTSFATPQVAGAAALLMSFDPSLSPDSVKRLLVAGADSGGWTAAKNGTTHPILNAFWSLRLAARNRGAPLCGNRVWAEGGRIIVQRTDTTVRDSIVTGMPGTLNWLSPLHGGRTVLFVDDSLGALRTDWSPGSGWSTPIAYSGPPFDSSAGGGAYAPFHVFSGLSHDGDSTVFLMRSWGGFPKRMGIDVATDDGSSQDVQYTFTDLPVDSLSPILAIFAPKGGGRVLMTMPTSTGTTLYRFPASFGAPVTVHTFAARHVYGLSMNETETEYVVTSGDMTLTPLPFDESTSGDCKIQYMDTSFAVLQTISAPNGCRTAWNVWGNT
jgi:hypothetical protein